MVDRGLFLWVLYQVSCILSSSTRVKSLWLKNYILNKPIFLYTILVDKLKHVISKVVTKSIIQIFSTQTDMLFILLLLYKMAFVNLTSRNRCYYLIHTKVWFTKKLHSHHSELSLTYYTKFLCMQTPLDPSPSFDSRANKFQGGAWNTIRYKNWLEDQMYLF